jgi:hypothetical protein
MGAYNSVGSPSTSSSSSAPLNTLYDEVSTTLAYVGKAYPGSLTSQPVWRIFRLTLGSGDMEILYADSGNFSQVWDNRASLSYP